MKDTNIFESTQVAFNLEFLALIPKTIKRSSFFIDLAEEMGVTYCEQIDNGCPVLLGLWSNILQAEKKLESLLQSWEGEHNNYIQVSTNETTKLDSDEQSDERRVTDNLIMESEVVLPSSSCPVVLTDNCTAVTPQTFFVSSEVTQIQSDEMLYSTLQTNPGSIEAEVGCDHIIVGKQVKDHPVREKKDIGSEIKEIYVDISVDSSKNYFPKKQSLGIYSNVKLSADQHPLDKLCKLLCIEEDEHIDVRINENEKSTKLDKNVPYKYFCDLCSFKANRENQLSKHLKLHEKINKILKCSQCEFKTIRTSVLSKHMTQHSSTQLLCKLCPYKTDTAGYLLKHLRVKHGSTNKKRKKCSHCDYVASSHRDLQKHNKLHHGSETTPKIWKCSKCPYKSKLRAHLSRHENDMHGSMRQFLCHYCGKSFKRNDTLTQHKIIHGEVNKTFTCQTCGKVCTSSVMFREHLAIHTAERPFLCDMCGGSFKTRAATQRHKRAMHPPIGTKPPSTQTNLNRHKRVPRSKLEDTAMPSRNVQDTVTPSPVTIQVVYTDQLQPH